MEFGLEVVWFGESLFLVSEVVACRLGVRVCNLWRITESFDIIGEIGYEFKVYSSVCFIAIEYLFIRL